MTATSIINNANQLTAIANRLRALPDVVAAYLHGSAAKERLRPDSDIDIALLFGGSGPSHFDLLDLSADLEIITGRPAHLGILSLEQLIYATEVHQHGKELFCLDEGCRDLFFMRMLSAYADYNYARREVLDTYLVRENDSDEYSSE